MSSARAGRLSGYAGVHGYNMDLKFERMAELRSSHDRHGVLNRPSDNSVRLSPVKAVDGFDTLPTMTTLLDLSVQLAEFPIYRVGARFLANVLPV